MEDYFELCCFTLRTVLDIETFQETSLQGATWGVEFVFFPICHVVFNIICNAVHFIVIANNMVMETGLPCKFDVVFVGKTGNGLFELTNDNGQP